MRYLKMIAGAALWMAHFAWAASPAFEGKLARIQLLDTGVVPAPEASGAKEVLRMVYLVSRQEGVSGQFTLREPRDALINGRSYREITRAELARDFDPKTSVVDAGAFARAQPSLWPEGARAEGALVITVELVGADIAGGSEVRSKLQLGFDKKTEPSEFTFRLAAE